MLGISAIAYSAVLRPDHAEAPGRICTGNSLLTYRIRLASGLGQEPQLRLIHDFPPSGILPRFSTVDRSTLDGSLRSDARYDTNARKKPSIIDLKSQ